MNIKDALRGVLTDDEILALGRSYEVIGDIAIIELDERLVDKKELIAGALASRQKNIRVVLLKTEDVSGMYRLPKYEVVFQEGERDFSWVPKQFRPATSTETVHREHGCRFKVDPTKAYFSSKMASERKRIAMQVKDGENIMCLFAGVGPFPIVASKSRDVRVTAVEINPEACRFFRENVAINKLDKKIEVVEGDAGKVLQSIDFKFDRIIMPAPKNASDFLEGALGVAKKGTFIHLYTFLAEEEVAGIGDVVSERCKKAGIDVEILAVRKCGNTGPHHYRVVIDFLVL